ncbi:hypothetical protein O181_090958 [Austropuccinia psidii MF-1]|uniref:Uncharacterized protein n=1 Tax=Austropuccinia psidii MF-1 TaxID=1389203 RepID=A0A9Q3IVY3_9BASI|nr:hypothetical protein [Austropuccinia psidii MF-1]
MWDPLGPFWPKYNEAKGGKGATSVGLKPHFGPPGPHLAIKSQGPKKARNQLFLLALVKTPSRNGIWMSPEATSHLQKGFPKEKRNPSSEMEPGMGNIWYDIPLCTIFPQQSNGDTFKTPAHFLKSSYQYIIPFQRKTLVTQAPNSWDNPEDHLRTSITWPFRLWPFHFNSITPRKYWPRILQGKFQEVVIHQISFKASKAPAFIEKLNWPIHSVIRKSVWN